MNNVVFQNFPSYNEFDLLKNEGFYQASVLRESAFIFIFVSLQKIDFFFVISLVSVEKLVSVEDTPSVSLREGR